MLHREPAISVIMSVFNGQEFLFEAINSILEQTFKNYEFIIVNDASTDKTSNILSEFAVKDKRIKIINNAKNMGLARSLNIAISEAKGNFIARMDADDYSYPDRLLIQYQHMSKHSDTIVCGTSMRTYEELRNKVPPLSHEEIVSSIVFDCPFYHPTVMIRKDILLKSGIIYPEDYEKAQDYGLWTELFLISINNNYKFINLPDTLLKYRTHPNKNRNEYFSEQQSYAAKSQLKLIHALGIDIDIESIIKINSSEKLSSNEVVYLDSILKTIINKIKVSLPVKCKKHIQKIYIAKKFKLYSRTNTSDLLGLFLKMYSRFLYLSNREKIKSVL
ncbi:glycosyltransferase [Photorhabdus sp. P32]|uniref:glycosyltransferase family 2 protein n=1 Tax=Photorhabdus sp. P32 TaxID=3117549 RepID=UPI00311B3552